METINLRRPNATRTSSETDARKSLSPLLKNQPTFNNVTTTTTNVTATGLNIKTEKTTKAAALLSSNNKNLFRDLPDLRPTLSTDSELGHHGSKSNHKINESTPHLQHWDQYPKDSPKYLLSLVQSVLPHFLLDIYTDPEDPAMLCKLSFYSLVALFIKNFVLTWYVDKIQSLNNDFLEYLDEKYISQIYRFFFTDNFHNLDFMTFLLDDIPFIVENTMLMHANDPQYKYNLKFVTVYCKEIKSPLERAFVKSLLQDFLFGKILKNVCEPEVLLPVILMTATRKKDNHNKKPMKTAIKPQMKKHSLFFKNQKSSVDPNDDFWTNSSVKTNSPVKKKTRIVQKTSSSSSSSSKTTTKVFSGFNNELLDEGFESSTETDDAESPDMVDLSDVLSIKQSVLYRYVFNFTANNLLKLDERKPLVYGFLKWLQYITVEYTSLDKLLYKKMANKIYQKFQDPTIMLLKARHVLFPNDCDLVKPNAIEVEVEDLIGDCQKMLSDVISKNLLERI
ncbi:hypothetical protein ACO0QE_002667 [Hanseniaspora vineae]